MSRSPSPIATLSVGVDCWSIYTVTSSSSSVFYSSHLLSSTCHCHTARHLSSRLCKPLRPRETLHSTLPLAEREHQQRTESVALRISTISRSPQDRGKPSPSPFSAAPGEHAQFLLTPSFVLRPTRWQERSRQLDIHWADRSFPHSWRRLLLPTLARQRRLLLPKAQSDQAQRTTSLSQRQQFNAAGP